MTSLVNSLFLPQFYWDIIDRLCKFKLYNIVIWGLCILQNDNHLLENSTKYLKNN